MMKIKYSTVGTFKSLKDFEKQHPEATLESVNGKDVFDFCGGCGKPLLNESTSYIYDPEDGYFCKKCAEAE